MFDFIITGYRWIFLQMASVLGPGWSIVALSFICSALMAPLMKAVGGIVKRETDYQSVINPQLEVIKAKYASDMERHLHIQRLYSRYSYSPLSAVKKVMPLFVQIPFLLLTYYMLKGTAELSGVSFLFLKDLGKADALIPVLHANLLPLVMTGVNILTVFATPSFTQKDWTQAIGIALLFLVLLYTAPSALLLYWTLNNTITCVRTLLAKKGEGARLLGARITALRHLPSVTWAWLTPPRLEAISLALFLVSLYMALMIVMNVWFFNCFISRILVCPILLAAISLQSLAALRAHGKISVAAILTIVLPAVLSCGLIGVAALSFFAPKTVQPIMAVYKPLNCFYVMAGIWLLIHALVLFFNRKACSEVFPSFLQEAHWLLLPVVLALHYSFSSALVKLPADSVFFLAVKLVIPAVLVSLSMALIFGKRISAQKLCRVGIVFVCAAYLVPMISLESGKILAYGSNLVVRLVFIAALVFASLRMNARKPILISLLLLFVMTGANAVYQRYAISEEVSARAETTGSEAERSFKAATATRSNNVYLLIYDSYSHDEVLQDLGVSSRLHEILIPRGFTRYDAYSVGSDTVKSMGNSFAIGGVTQGSIRSMMAGNNPFCDFLKRAGYSTSYLLCAYDMPGRGELMPGDYYFPAPQAVTRLENILFTCILRGYLSQSANTFNSYSSEEWTAEKRRVLRNCPSSNAFVYAHCEWPAHATANEAYRKSMAEEIAAYAERVVKADAEIEADLDLVLSKNDDALIIVASDHGSCLRLCERGDYGRLDLLDRCGIQLYIRWPKNYQPTLDLKCLTNVFLETMICLSGDSSLARFAVEGESLPVQAPLKAPAGAIVNGVIQSGRDKGKSLFHE